MGLRDWFFIAKFLKKGIDVGMGKKTEAQMTQEIEQMVLGNIPGGLPTQLGDVQGVVGNIQSAVSNIEGAVSGVQVPLKNMQGTAANIQAKITAMQTSPNTGDVTNLRTYLMSYYGHLMQGGDPLPNPLDVMAIKATPQYAALKEGYPALHQALAAIEMEREQCIFGYQMADGTIYAPDLSWTLDQWNSVREQAVDQTARCWKAEVAPAAVAPAAVAPVVETPAQPPVIPN